MATAYVRFQKNFGRKPNQSSNNNEERELANWHKMLSLRTTKLNDAQYSMLQRLGIYISPPRKINEVVALDATGRDISREVAQVEEKLQEVQSQQIIIEDKSVIIEVEKKLTSAELFEEKSLQVALFKDEHGYLPQVNSADAVENELAVWLESAINNANNDEIEILKNLEILANENKSNEENSAINIDEMAEDRDFVYSGSNALSIKEWQKRCDEVLDFYKQHGRVPSASRKSATTEQERKLGSWYSNTKSNIFNNRHTEVMTSEKTAIWQNLMRKLEAIKAEKENYVSSVTVSKTQSADKFKAKAQEFGAFVKAHGRWPKSYGNDKEAALHSWRNYHEKNMTADKVSALKEVGISEIFYTKPTLKIDEVASQVKTTSAFSAEEDFMEYETSQDLLKVTSDKAISQKYEMEMRQNIDGETLKTLKLIQKFGYGGQKITSITLKFEDESSLTLN